MDSDAEGEASEDDGAERPLSKEEILAKYIQDNVRGGKSTFKGPFGRKEVRKSQASNLTKTKRQVFLELHWLQLVFCDYIYNGRSLTFLEDFLTSEVYPLLSTDTLSTSVSALQSTMYLDEIR